VLSKNNNCFRELYIQLRSIFVIAIFRNVMEIGLPILFNFLNGRTKRKYYKKLKESNEDQHKLLSKIEKTMDKGTYSYGEIDGTYNDYLEISIQMGYILLFGLAFPLVFALAFINNIIEHQVDRAKLIYFTRRPNLIGGDSIGIWKTILYFMSTIGVFTYAAILCVTAETFTKDESDQFIQFLWCSIIFLIIRWSVGYMIIDVPKRYTYVLKRHKHIANKFLVGMPETSIKDQVFNEKTKLAVH
jgi:hypothetical protein